jgi:agmatine/peptidylarginine deiminase
MYKDSQHAPSANVTRANKAKLERALTDNGLTGYKIVEVPMPDPCDSFNPVTGNACAGVETLCPLNPKCSLTSLSTCPPSAVFDHADCLYYKRVPGRTYINLFFLNNEVHVPVFPKDNKYEAEALQIIAKETGKVIVKHDGEVLAYQSGSVHCITKQIPRLSLFTGVDDEICDV